VVENPDQPSMPISSVHSSKLESVSRGEVRRESVSSQLLDVDLVRCHEGVCMQDTPAINSKTEELSKIREAHQKERAAGRCVSHLKSKATL